MTTFINTQDVEELKIGDTISFKTKVLPPHFVYGTDKAILTFEKIGPDLFRPQKKLFNTLLEKYTDFLDEDEYIDDKIDIGKNYTITDINLTFSEILEGKDEDAVVVVFPSMEVYFSNNHELEFPDNEFYVYKNSIQITKAKPKEKPKEKPKGKKGVYVSPSLLTPSNLQKVAEKVGFSHIDGIKYVSLLDTPDKKLQINLIGEIHNMYGCEEKTTALNYLTFFDNYIMGSDKKVGYFLESFYSKNQDVIKQIHSKTLLLSPLTSIIKKYKKFIYPRSKTHKNVYFYSVDNRVKFKDEDIDNFNTFAQYSMLLTDPNNDGFQIKELVRMSQNAAANIIGPLFEDFNEFVDKIVKKLKLKRYMDKSDIAKEVIQKEINKIKNNLEEYQQAYEVVNKTISDFQSSLFLQKVNLIKPPKFNKKFHAELLKITVLHITLYMDLYAIGKVLTSGIKNMFIHTGSFHAQNIRRILKQHRYFNERFFVSSDINCVPIVDDKSRLLFNKGL